MLSSGGISVALDLLGSIDIEAERARITKALEATAKEIKQTAAKLGNPGFLAKAPDSVVEEIRARNVGAEQEQLRLNDRLKRLG